MANFSKLIEKKADAAQYMVDEITHICKDMPKRTPGEEGERIACEYMADVLKKTADANAPTLNRLRKIPAAFSAGFISRSPVFLRGLSHTSSCRF